MDKKRDLILNPFFVIGLLTLIINDTYLKWEFHNTITGKLSDFAGLFILPLFLSYLIPRIAKYSSVFVGISFIIWKSPLVDPALEFINKYSIIEFKRVIDITDLIALSILFFSHFLIIQNQKTNSISFQTYLGKILRPIVLISAFMAFAATSMVPNRTPEGTVLIDKEYAVRLPKDSIISRIQKMGYNCTFIKDSLYPNQDMGYYQIDNIKVIRFNQHIETIQNVKLELNEISTNKTQIKLINVSLQSPRTIQDWKELKYLSKTYKSYLKKNLIEKIK